MNSRFQFTAQSSAKQQLLAMSIVLLDVLRTHHTLTLWVPMTVHQALSASDYGLLLYDTLAAEHLDLETRLHLRVHSANHFDIGFSH
jgi:hypothetical protein